MSIQDESMVSSIDISTLTRNIFFVTTQSLREREGEKHVNDGTQK